MNHASHFIVFSMPGLIGMNAPQAQSLAHNSIEVTPV